MAANPAEADGRPADVWSIAKTLWVLATGQNYPPAGEQRIDVPQLCLSTYTLHADAGVLDLLIERATRTDPARRPTMLQFAEELNAWLSPESLPRSGVDLETVSRDLATALEPSRRQQQERQAYEQRFHTVRSALETGLEDIVEKARSAGVELRLSRNSVVIPRYFVRFRLHGVRTGIVGGDVALSGTKADRPAYLGNPNSFYLYVGVGVVELDNDDVLLCAAHLLGMNEETATELWMDSAEVLLGSASERRAVDGLISGLADNLPAALAALAARIREFGL